MTFFRPNSLVNAWPPVSRMIVLFILFLVFFSVLLCPSANATPFAQHQTTWFGHCLALASGARFGTSHLVSWLSEFVGTCVFVHEKPRPHVRAQSLNRRGWDVEWCQSAVATRNVVSERGLCGEFWMSCDVHVLLCCWKGMQYHSKLVTPTSTTAKCNAWIPRTHEHR